MKRQPLRNLRKTTIVVIAVFLGFLIHRIVAFCLEDVTIHDTAESALIDAHGVVCSHIVDDSPFGIDSIFDEETRLHFYSTFLRSSLKEDDTLVHIWFNGVDTVHKAPCKIVKESCNTSVEPNLIKPGDWSVDLVAGRRLLATQQFKVVAHGR